MHLTRVPRYWLLTSITISVQEIGMRCVVSGAACCFCACQFDTSEFIVNVGIDTILWRNQPAANSFTLVPVAYSFTLVLVANSFTLVPVINSFPLVLVSNPFTLTLAANSFTLALAANQTQSIT